MKEKGLPRFVTTCHFLAGCVGSGRSWQIWFPALQVGVPPSHFGLRSSVQIGSPRPKKSPFSNFPVDCNYPNLFLLLRNRKNSTAPPSSQQNRRLVIKSAASVRGC